MPEITAAINFTPTNYGKILDRLKTETRRVAKLPVKVRLPFDVRGDYPIGHSTIARAGDYVATLNDYGAVCVKAEDGNQLGIKPSEFLWLSARYKVGETLALRTSWAVSEAFDYCQPSTLPAALTRVGIWFDDGVCKKPEWAGKTRPAMFLPKVFWHLCRKITIIRVRIERLKVISTEDIQNEGVQLYLNQASGELLLPLTGKFKAIDYLTPEIIDRPTWTEADKAAIWRAHWAASWNAINHEKHPWESNPFVEAYTFDLEPAA